MSKEREVPKLPHSDQNRRLLEEYSWLAQEEFLQLEIALAQRGIRNLLDQSYQTPDRRLDTT